MQIRKLVVDDHKCLVDFLVKFRIVDGGSSTILIGENGTGKSTMLETLLDIFMSFDSPAVEKQINYSYELEYLFAGSIIQISCKVSSHNASFKPLQESVLFSRIIHINHFSHKVDLSIPHTWAKAIRTFVWQ